MYDYHLIISFIFVIRSIKSSQIEIDIPSISSSHTFELTSNTSRSLHRDVLFGLVDGSSSSISSSILVRASYEQVHIERFFNLYESKNQQNQQQQITKEPIFRSYLLTPTFNRSYPFIRVLVASAQGSYENLPIQPLCATITAVNEENLYESQTCFISPTTGYCLTTISVLKMIESTNKNQTTTNIELYLKLHHVRSFNECISNHPSKQSHIHHEARIGHAEYLDNENLIFSTINRSPISIDYPAGIHYSNWYFPLKLKLILSSSSSLSPSSIIRCRLRSYFSIHSIQTNILKISNYLIQISHKIHHRSSTSDIDFPLTINAVNQTNSNSLFEIDLATIILRINATNIPPNDTNSVLFIDWFILSNSSFTSHEPFLRVPIRVQYDDIQIIVPLTDFTSLINTAMLSMRIEQYPLKILAVNHSGSIQSITEVFCHSENIYLIQVDSTCTHVYFSGHERDDFFDHVNSPASIVVRYEKYLQRLYFTIYIPERPLRIELSDAKLSRINGWFITSREEQISESSTHTDDEDDEEEDDEEDHVKCDSVYQQSSVQVFTKFYRTTPNGDRIYLFNKLNVLVTRFVRSQLKTDNTRVAIIKHGRVLGISPGETSVLIYSFANKFPIGSKRISVDNKELIQIRNISFNLLTNIDIQTSSLEHLDPIYQIHFRVKPIFNRLNLDQQNQFGQINVILTYSDNTSISLDEIPSDYYQFDLDRTRINSALIHLNSSISWKTLRVYPIDLGQTSLHARLKLGQQQCTDDRTFSQNDLSREITIVSTNKTLQPSSSPQTDHHVVLKNNTTDHRTKTSPLLIVVSILLGACVVLFVSFLLHWLINCYLKRKSKNHPRRQRYSTQSGAEEDNHDWIFLDRNSLEMPLKQQQTSPSIHDSTLNITPNPILHPSTLQRQKDLPGLSDSQMIAYFDNLKESHA